MVEVVKWYRVTKKEWTPYNTKFGLFLIILCKSYEKISHWLGLDDLFATSKPTNVRFFHKFCMKWSDIDHILYYRGSILYLPPCISVYALITAWFCGYYHWAIRIAVEWIRSSNYKWKWFSRWKMRNYLQNNDIPNNEKNID